MTKIEAFYKLVDASEGPSPEQASTLSIFGPFQWAVFEVFSQLAAFAHFDPLAANIGKKSLLSLHADN